MNMTPFERGLIKQHLEAALDILKDAESQVEKVTPWVRDAGTGEKVEVMK